MKWSEWRCGLRIGLFGLSCLAAAGGHATPPPAPALEALHAGVQAFRDNQLRRARGLFLEAYNAGLRSAKLFYNLGVVHYRLGEYEQARQFFLRGLDHPPSHQLIQYNLARCAEKLEQPDAAASWYAKAMNGRDPRVAGLARRARRALLSQREEQQRLLVSLNTGFDSAVVGLVDQVTSLPTDNSDLFASLLIQGLLPSRSKWFGPGQWEFSGFAQQYAAQQQVNVQSLAMSWRTERDTSRQRRWFVKMQLAHDWLDGDSYQLRVGPDIELSHNWRGLLVRHHLGVEFLNARDDVIQGIGGLRAELSSAVLRRLFSGVGMLRLGLEFNERESDEFSPRRYAAELFWRSPQLGPWQLGPGLQWRHSDYQDGRADERRLRALLRLDSPLDGAADARVQLQYEDNDADDPRQAYEHFRVTLGLRWSL